MTDRRRLFISADLEGVAGVVSPQELVQGSVDYDTACEQLTREVNAAIAGALRADPAVEVIVTDGHGTYRNIVPNALDERASLLRGKPRPLAMMHGVEPGDGVMLIGYHAKAGSPGVLSHTFDDVIRDVRCNGASLGELGLNTALATERGATVLLVTGDDALAAEVVALLPDVPVVEVKAAASSSAAVSPHPARACAVIEAEAEAAVAGWNGHGLRLQLPIELDVEFAHRAQADRAELPPPVARIDAGTVRVSCDSVADAYRWVRALIVLAAAH